MGAAGRPRNASGGNAEICQKRGGGGGLRPKSLCTDNGPIRFSQQNFGLSRDGHFLVRGGGGLVLQCLDHHNPPQMEKQEWWGQDSDLTDLREKIHPASGSEE